MRVISGKYRAKKLAQPKDNAVRPTSDRVKESLFNILQAKIAGAKVLDLFSGSGALSVEAVSRGAYAAAVDIDTALVERNFRGIDGDYDILQCDYLAAIKILAAKGQRFNLIFCDPPYRTDMAAKAVDAILKNDLLTDGGVIVVECDEGSIPKFSQEAIITDERKYGKTKLFFVTKS